MPPRTRAPRTQATTQYVIAQPPQPTTTQILLAIAIVAAVCVGFLLVLAMRTSETSTTRCVDGVCTVESGLFPLPCSRCQSVAPATPPTSNLQSLAQAEADEMRRRRYRGHVGQTLGDFEGCGWTSDPNGLAPTCEPPNASYTLAADASSSDSTGSYRVRAWVKR